MNVSKLIVANWKSNKTVAEAQEWVESFLRQEKRTNRQYVICPSFVQIGIISRAASHDSSLSVGMQDISPFEAGAYTGAVSAQNVRGYDVKYVIIGHSERRKYFHETYHDIARKVESALTADITPIVCMDRGDISALADEIDSRWHSRIIPTYEPVDAISTFGGHEHAIAEVIKTIETLRSTFRCEQVLYGGSVDPENALTYLQPTEIDGALVGGASLDAQAFLQL